jgi:hypothetical protein
MMRKILKYAEFGQIIALLILLGLLIFFLKNAGMHDIFIVIATAVILGIILLPWSEVEEFDKEDIIDWKLINHLSNEDD